jgi:peptide/nickel transport system permease protein
VGNGRYQISLLLGIVILCILTGSIVGAPLWSAHDPLQPNVEERLQKPSIEHPLGTDRFGRDVLARTLHGGKSTLIASLTALGAAITIGLLAGLLAGMYHGSTLDTLLMRLIDVLLAFPFIVLAMVLAALFGTSLFHLLIAVVSVWWVSFARVTRSIVLDAKSDTSYAAARVLGASDGIILLRELLPKVMGPIFVLATFELGSLILSISALSFLGLGSQPPSPEWGSMLADGRDHFMQAPHILLGPALFIMLTVLGFNLVGEGLRERMDPYEKPVW